MCKWITRTGEEIPYKDLSINHIYNIINYAKTHGFKRVRTSKSVVDNMDDIEIVEDISEKVIQDMKQELSKRTI